MSRRRGKAARDLIPVTCLTNIFFFFFIYDNGDTVGMQLGIVVLTHISMYYTLHAY